MIKKKQKTISPSNSIIPMGPASKADKKTKKTTLAHIKQRKKK
jgi:hypothetical protein